MLPREIVHRKERGFITPVDRWLRRDMQAYARETAVGSWIALYAAVPAHRG